MTFSFLVVWVNDQLSPQILHELIQYLSHLLLDIDNEICINRSLDDILYGLRLGL